MKKQYFIICSILTILALATCSGNSDLSGSWQSVITDEVTLEFQGHGVLYEYWEDEINGTYDYELDGDKLTIDQYGDLFILQVDGNRLIYEGETLYTRAPK